MDSMVAKISFAKAGLGDILLHHNIIQRMLFMVVVDFSKDHLSELDMGTL